MTVPRGAMTPARMKRIWEREGGICWFCTKPVPQRGGDVVRYDHRIPIEILGHDGDENIYPLHREPCDRLKTLADQAKIAKTRRMGGERGSQTQRRENAGGSKLQGRPFQKGVKRAWGSRPFPKTIK